MIWVLRKGEAGFTLIELMIVILVILILASILVPQFALAQERARKAKCVSNQRNLETAVAMWATDNTTTNYTGGTMDSSVPGYTALTTTGQPQYTTPGAFIEPDKTYTGNPTGSEYYLSMGAASGNANGGAPSYGHVSCVYAQDAGLSPCTGNGDPWVNCYDASAHATANGLNHTRGASMSP